MMLFLLVHHLTCGPMVFVGLAHGRKARNFRFSSSPGEGMSDI